MDATQYLDKLLEATEAETGRTFIAVSDFEWLADKLFERTGERVSSSTLMRLWGKRQGVTPRKSTLDIMAHYVGYADYPDFRRACEENGRKQQEADTAIKQYNHKRRVRKYLVAAVLFILACGGVVTALITRSKTPCATSLSDISSHKQYYIRTKDGSFGTLGVEKAQLATEYGEAMSHRCDSVSTFAILRDGGYYYLYSIADKRFINVLGHETDYAGEFDSGTKLQLTQNGSYFAFDFFEGKSPITLNVTREDGIVFKYHGTADNIFDDGNMFCLEEAGDFDPTEALSRLGRDKAHTRAIRSLQDGKTYAVCAPAAPDKPGFHYLRADGTLGDKLTDDARFTLHALTGDSVYGGTAFRLCNHPRSNACPNKAFIIPFSENGKFETGAFSLSTVTMPPTLWGSQVFYQDKNGRYAIRSTAVPFEWHGCNTFWNVSSKEGNGTPAVSLSHEKRYIWELIEL